MRSYRRFWTACCTEQGAASVRRTSANGQTEKKISNERTKEYEIQFLAEANVTPRSVARFGQLSIGEWPPVPDLFATGRESRLG
jgi:hypothetical protein